MKSQLAAIALLISTACAGTAPPAPASSTAPTEPPTAAAPTTTPTAAAIPASPPARGYHRLVSIGDRGVLMFGGETAGPALGGRGLTDTWALRSAAKWAPLGLEPLPKAALGEIAYDTKAGRVILIGGAGESFEQQRDVYIYDVKADRWERRPAAPDPNPVRDGALHGARVAYLPKADQVIVIGQDQFDPKARTYAYDVNANTWTNKAPTIAPPARGWAAFALDEASGVVVLFGGSDRADTWTYDVSSNTWTEMRPPTSPPGRQYHSMVYEPKSGRMILFGGTVGGFRDEKPLGDTWSYDPKTNTWTDLKPAVAPPARGWHAMAYDATSGMVVLFGGGIHRGRFTADTWLYDPARNVWSSLP